MKEHVTEIQQERFEQLRRVLEERRVGVVFQPIFGFREGRIVAYEALVRGPEGSLLQSPAELFSAAQHAGLMVELNSLCVQEILQSFARAGLDGSLFINISPQLIMQRGFDQERARRFMRKVALDPARVVIELTEDYPTVDFRFVHESLMLYRAMGFRIAIDDLGEGFASLRLWSELRPEYVKADKHFVRGISDDPVKLQFLHAIQHIAENSGSQVVAEGIEGPEDFRVVKDIGIACGQGWFIGHPALVPNTNLSAEAEAAYADARVPVVTAPRLRPGSEPCAQDFLRAVRPVHPTDSIGAALRRFLSYPALTALPLADGDTLLGVVSRTQLELIAASPDAARLLERPCAEVVDDTPIRIEASLGLGALTAVLVETDARRLADGFVIVAQGRYLGMGTSADVMRALQNSRVLAGRYTNPLTMLPGQVPINEHLERLLGGRLPFSVWFVEVDQMRGLNDCEGFTQGDALIHSTARLLEELCQPGMDFVGHISGSRFVMLMQSEDWHARAGRALEGFPKVLRAHVAAEAATRGYFTTRGRDLVDKVRPLPRLAVGIVPVLPGVFETRHEAFACAKRAAHEAMKQPGSAIHVDEQAGNAYPRSMLY